MNKLLNKKALEIKLDNRSKYLRQLIVQSLIGGGRGHMGSAMSLVEILRVLYDEFIKFNPKKPKSENRDRLILSKGHGCLAYYAALCEFGYFSREEFSTFEKTNSRLLGHPVIDRSIGIEFSNGSLGMGLGLGIGVAIAGKKRNRDYTVYIVMGDGECNEGSVWEGAMAASQFSLDNLVVVIDKNNYQQTGSNKEIMNVGNLTEKWKGFGWEAKEVDGHNTAKLYDVLARGTSDRKPLAIIANTIKGKGVSFAENDNAWHHAVITKKLHEMAIDEITPRTAEKK